MTCRAYMPEDFDTVKGWAEAKGIEIVPQLLSKTGFIAEADGRPVMAVWAYLLFDVPIVQLDHLLSPPGTKIAEIRKAWEKLMIVIKDWIRIRNEKGGTGYCVIRCFIHERLAREAARAGWLVRNHNTHHCTLVL